MLSKSEIETINQAKTILSNLFKKENLWATSHNAVIDYCMLNIAHLDHEVFGVLFLDNQHRLIKEEIIFRGTVDSCSVYPREIAKNALLCNASAIILFHNHPSGLLLASDADKAITKKVSSALSLIDIRTLDHIIVSNNGGISFANLGLI